MAGCGSSSVTRSMDTCKCALGHCVSVLRPATGRERPCSSRIQRGLDCCCRCRGGRGRCRRCRCGGLLGSSLFRRSLLGSRSLLGRGLGGSLFRRSFSSFFRRRFFGRSLFCRGFLSCSLLGCYLFGRRLFSGSFFGRYLFGRNFLHCNFFSSSLFRRGLLGSNLLYGHFLGSNFLRCYFFSGSFLCRRGFSSLQLFSPGPSWRRLFFIAGLAADFFAAGFFCSCHHFLLQVSDESRNKQHPSSKPASRQRLFKTLATKRAIHGRTRFVPAYANEYGKAHTAFSR